MAKYTDNDIDKLHKNNHGKTDWKRLERQTEKDIHQAAMSDKDAPLLSSG